MISAKGPWPTFAATMLDLSHVNALITPLPPIATPGKQAARRTAPVGASPQRTPHTPLSAGDASMASAPAQGSPGSIGPSPRARRVGYTVDLASQKLYMASLNKNRFRASLSFQEFEAGLQEALQEHAQMAEVKFQAMKAEQDEKNRQLELALARLARAEETISMLTDRVSESETAHADLAVSAQSQVGLYAQQAGEMAGMVNRLRERLKADTGASTGGAGAWMEAVGHGRSGGGRGGEEKGGQGRQLNGVAGGVAGVVPGGQVHPPNENVSGRALPEASRARVDHMGVHVDDSLRRRSPGVAPATPGPAVVPAATLGCQGTSADGSIPGTQIGSRHTLQKQPCGISMPLPPHSGPLPPPPSNPWSRTPEVHAHGEGGARAKGVQGGGAKLGVEEEDDDFPSLAAAAKPPPAPPSGT